MMSRKTRTADMQHLDLTELGFEVCHTQEEQLIQLKRLRDMPCPISVKRTLRTRLMNQDVKSMSGWKGWQARQKMERKKCSLACKNFSNRMELWQGSFKEIEGHFGSGVLSYFIFLKWLFQLNLLIFGLVFLFIVAPQLVLNDNNDDAPQYTKPCNSSDKSMYQNLEWNGDVVPACSALYQNSTQTSNHSVTNYIADFFQGTGFMENTILFYGYYSSSDLKVDIGVVKNYNIPLAYILVTSVYFILSLLLMVRASAHGFKESISSGEDKYYQHCNKVFGTWDFALSDAKNVTLKKKSIYKEITHDLHEQRDADRREKRTQKQWCGLWTLRIVINIFVLAALGGSGYLIYFATQWTSETVLKEEYETYHVALQLLIEFTPSLTITILNILVPLIFEKIVSAEDYTPLVEVQLTLIRTVFLRLASLALLFAALYNEISCKEKDEDEGCNVGKKGQCQQLRCWETGIGQELYKLVIMDFIVPLGMVIFVEFPRKLIVSKCDCKLSKIIGYQQFVIPKNVLDLVYSQTLCWLGSFFSPLIPGLCIAKFFIMFYSKKISLLANFVPNTRPYRASRSNTFFVVVLLLSFLLCCFPVVYVISAMAPSRGCGPFRPYAFMYESAIAAICEWPEGFQQFLKVATSFTFNIIVVMCLALAIYYQSIAIQGHKMKVTLLKDQLIMEGKDKQFLVAKLNEGKDKSKGSNTDDRRNSKHHQVRNDTLEESPEGIANDAKYPQPQALYKKRDVSSDSGTVGSGV